MLSSLKIGNRSVGPEHPCFIIAEAGVNHDGDLDRALALVDIAVRAGADAVKFQTFCTEAIVTRRAPKAEYQRRTTGSSEGQFEMLKRLELSEKSHVRLIEHCTKQSIIFLSTPYDCGSVDLLDRLGVPAFKISSTDTTNLPLLTYAAGKSRPIILSTGMCSHDEVAQAVTAIHNSRNEAFALMQCTSQYPAPVAEINLRVMRTFERTFQCPVGYSDHTLGIVAAIWAVAAGASLIEKHFTLDRSTPGPDHAMSLVPAELKELVQTIRNIEAVLGDGIKRVMPCELQNKLTHQKSIVVRRRIKLGEVITLDHLTCKRPGTGLSPHHIDKVAGRRVTRDLEVDELIDWSALQST